MAKKRSWFSYVKGLFFSDSNSRQEKEREKKKKKWFFGKLRSKRSPALPAPSSSQLLNEAEDEQNKHVVAVAVATVAAAEAAVAAAQAAAEVVRLTASPLPCQNKQEFSAIKIQTAFRGYLARRALRALKALVKLQAIVRGRAVRRQTSITLKNLQSLIKIQKQARANRVRMSLEIQALEAKEQLWRKATTSGEKAYQIFEEQNEKIWDDSPLSKAEIKAKFISRQEAALKRERALEYASSHRGRRSTRRHSLPLGRESDETDDLNRRWSWLEHWVDKQSWDKDIPEMHPASSPKRNACDPHENRMLKPSSDPESIKRDIQEQQLKPMMRRSFNRSRRSYIRDDESFSSSPAFPSYMAYTESAKARTRSISTPKQRVGTRDIFPDSVTLQSSKVSPFPSICSDIILAKPNKVHQRSPRVRGTPRSSRFRISMRESGSDF